MRVLKVEVVDSVPKVIQTINTIITKNTNNQCALVPHAVVEEVRDALEMKVSRISNQHLVVAPETHLQLTRFKNNSLRRTAPHQPLVALFLSLMSVISRPSLNLIKMANS